MGSGSHFPFPIHIDVLGPISSNPGGQCKVMLVPSLAGIMWPVIIRDSPKVFGSSQLSAVLSID